MDSQSPEVKINIFKRHKKFVCKERKPTDNLDVEEEPEKAFELEQELIRTFTSGTDEEFQSTLKNFPDFKDVIITSESDKATYFYKALFQHPKEMKYFKTLMKNFTIKKEDFEPFMDVMLNLNFYSNFNKILKYCKNTMEVRQKTDKHIQSLLKIKSWEEMNIDKLENLNKRGINVMENVLKYSLLHHGPVWVAFKDKQVEIPSKFITMVSYIVAKDDENNFSKTFQSHFEELRKLFPDNWKIAFNIDVSILVQTSYLRNNHAVVETLLNYAEIDIGTIKIPIENETVPMIIAEKGYHKLLMKYLQRETNPEILHELYKTCLKGHRNYETNRTGGEKGFDSEQNYEKCFDLLIRNDSFKIVIKEHSPMREALKCDNKCAISQLIIHYGLNLKFLNELDSRHIEEFLNSQVTEESGDQENHISIDYRFMKAWEFSLLSIARTSKIKFVITHPVIRIFVDFMMKRFEKLFILNLALYLIFFVLPLYYGFILAHFMGYLISALFLLIRETFQYFFVRNFRSHYDYEMMLDAMTRDQKMKVRDIFYYFFKSIVNVLEGFLILMTFLTSGSLFLAQHLDGTEAKYVEQFYRLFLVMTILLGTIELSLLTSSVFTKQGIYMMMLKTVAHTFLKTLFVLFMFIVSFTFCFHVIFYERNFITKNDSIKLNDTEQKITNFKDFDRWWISFLRVTVMLAGEYEASNINYNHFWFASVFLFGFILSAFMLYNFINGLAIDDVQTLRKQSEFYDIKFKILLISRHNQYTKFILKSQNLLCSFFRLILEDSNELIDCKISKNAVGKFEMHNQDSHASHDIDTDSLDNIRSLLMMETQSSELKLIKEKINYLQQIMLENLKSK